MTSIHASSVQPRRLPALSDDFERFLEAFFRDDVALREAMKPFLARLACGPALAVEQADLDLGEKAGCIFPSGVEMARQLLDYLDETGADDALGEDLRREFWFQHVLAPLGGFLCGDTVSPASASLGSR